MKSSNSQKLKIQTSRRNLAFKELEAKETPDGKAVAFSIKFVTKNGELVFIYALTRGSQSPLQYEKQPDAWRCAS